MNGLIRYRGGIINLNSVFCMFKSYTNPQICFVATSGLGNGEALTHEWKFETLEEQNKVFDYILNTYFTDIEKEMSK